MEHDGQLWPWKWKLIDKLAHVRTGRTSCPTRKNLPASNLHRMSSVAPRVHPWKMTLKIIEIKLSPYLRVNRGWRGKIRWLITCRASHTRTGRSRSLVSCSSVRRAFLWQAAPGSDSGGRCEVENIRWQLFLNLFPNSVSTLWGSYGSSKRPGSSVCSIRARAFSL
jgi:hypothetical protein